MGRLWEPGEKYFSPRRYSRNSNKRTFLFDTGRNPAWKKFFGQTVVSLFIFVFIWGLFQFDAPVIRPVQGRIRDWFTEDYDIQPVIKFFSEVGLWGDTFERAAFEMTKPVLAPEALAVPVSGQIVRPFGWVAHAEEVESFNDGIVIAAAEGALVKAALGGTVTRIANEEELGRLIEITSREGYVTTYGHCSEILVNFDDQVTMGQVIGKVGKTGSASYPQLYFRITLDGEPLNPADLFIPSDQRS